MGDFGEIGVCILINNLTFVFYHLMFCLLVSHAMEIILVI